MIVFVKEPIFGAQSNCTIKINDTILSECLILSVTSSPTVACFPMTFHDNPHPLYHRLYWFHPSLSLCRCRWYHLCVLSKYFIILSHMLLSMHPPCIFVMCIYTCYRLRCHVVSFTCHIVNDKHLWEK